MASAAAKYPPYTVDEATLHLWHLDESGPPFADSGSSPAELLGLLNGASAGAQSLEGFGTAVHFRYSSTTEPGVNPPYGPILLAKSQLDIGPLDNMNPPFPVMGDDGAFTMEALVKLDMLPADSPGLAADIISMDDDTHANRVFLFRIEKPGFLSFIPISGDAVRGGGLATIPTRGPHALNTHDWFHVAVTYDGNENISDNLKLYWTRIGPGVSEANQIGGGTLTTDLRRELGDFAIGNSGKFNSQGPFEYFPGSIDEVRLSRIARRPHEFFFVSPAAKMAADARLALGNPKLPHAGLMLQNVFVDDQVVPMRADHAPLVIGPGLHRVDFDFGFLAGAIADPLAVRCRLEGIDDDWHATARGMTLTWEMLDGEGNLIGRTVFSTTRSSPGWESDVLDSPMAGRSEPLFIPEMTRRIRVSMSSGTPDTTGCWVIDDLSLTRSSKPDLNLWKNGDFSEGERLDQTGGIPSGWTRGGSEPGIARVILAQAPALGLLDAAQGLSGYWVCSQDLPVRPAAGGEPFLLNWSEAFNVIPGTSLRASYMNMQPGPYTFRAISVVDGPQARTTQLAFPFTIRQPYWKHAWFLPSVVALSTMLVGLELFRNYRRHSRSRIAAIRLAGTVERDRARIARDMHDDLGTRVSLLKHAAAIIRRAIDREPEKAHRLALRLDSAATDLVWAMDGLVWAVNPANDSLEHLASHLSGVAQEIFRDAPVRVRISIPINLPALPLRSDFRHHFSLAVKEVLHNILKHAGPCEASLQIQIEDSTLIARITDNGVGFDTANPKPGNGLANLLARATEMGGSCDIDSSPGAGMRIVLCCPLPELQLQSRT
ncbi:MAG: hypothetical protein K9N23_06525 [Akkermansiaceae bacterium]|nr:hypothetical protein [Akkermansiaceae bacterium]